tara:strand:+ start:6782 stop:8401 length:1620 start_codon:yes stop_codon:yes gene_type:complete
MIQMAQDFMDILRIKKEDDEGAVTEAAEEVDGRRIDPSEKEGKTGTQLLADDRRKKEKEGKKYEALAEADKKQKLETARTVTMWKEILEKFSKTGDITNPSMQTTMKEFNKSYLIPRTTSKTKIDNFYQSIVQKTAPRNLLEVFYQDAEELGIKISGDTTAFDTQVERKYNGKESLAVLRDFLDESADMPRGLLSGKRMNKKQLLQINRLLAETERIDIDSLPEDPDVLLVKLRELVLTLDRIKEVQESTLNKSADSGKGNIRIPDWVNRRIKEEVDKQTKDIEDDDEREKAREELSKKLRLDFVTGKFPPSTPESRAAAKRVFENLSSAAQRQTQKVREGRGKNIQELKDRINSGESLLEELKQKLSQTRISGKKMSEKELRERTKIKSKIRATEKQIRDAQITLEQKYKIKESEEVKQPQTTIDAKDLNWEWEGEVAAREAEGNEPLKEPVKDFLGFQASPEMFDTYRNIVVEIPVLIDKIEEILEMVLNLRNNAVTDSAMKKLDKAHKKMKQLIKVTVGSFKFKLEDGKTRAININ